MAVRLSVQLMSDIFSTALGTILISSEEGETDGEPVTVSVPAPVTHRALFSVDNLPRTLSEFGVGSGSRLRTDDFLQNYQLVLNITHRQVTRVTANV